MSTISISTRLIFEAAKKRGLTCSILDETNNLIVIKRSDDREFIFNMSLSELNSGIGHQIATNKDMTRVLCEYYGVAHPPSTRYLSMDGALDFLKLHERIVVKPADTDHGVGITVGIDGPEELKTAIEYASKYSNSILLQKQLSGEDHRFLVVGDQVFAVAKRRPPLAVGDGTSTIAELVEVMNQHEWRGADHESPLTEISIDDVEKYVGDVDRVLSKGEELQLLGVANLSQGGEAIDLTDEAHADNKSLAVELAQKLGLRVAGVDIMIEDVAQSYKQSGGAVLEVNKIPGLRMHHYPMHGKPRDAAGAILDELSKHS